MKWNSSLHSLVRSSLVLSLLLSTPTPLLVGAPFETTIDAHLQVTSSGGPYTPQVGDYFVSTTGDDGASGGWNDPWRTIAHGLSVVGPGETLYVKAGTYNERLVFTQSGTPIARIRVIGYRAVPGDVSYTPFDHLSSLDANAMPLLDGLDRTTGIGIQVFNRSYVEISNFQITGSETGFHGYGCDYVNLENIVATELGDRNAPYSGFGIRMDGGSTYCNITRCTVVNACAENFSGVGSYCNWTSCRSFCDDDLSIDASTDYYFVLSGSDHCTITDCYLERVGDLPHVGHGFQLLGTTNNCDVINSRTENLSGAFTVRGPDVRDNTFTNCISNNDNFAILMREGAHHNTFTGFVGNGTKIGCVSFADSTEYSGQNGCGFDNVVSGSTFTGIVGAVVSHFHSEYVNSASNDNTIDNCTFDGAAYMFELQTGPNSGNAFTNCTFSNIAAYATYGNGLGIGALGWTHTTAAGNVDGGGLGFNLNNPGP